jgi:MFS transporter, putative metabolite:H+ symporter
MNIFLGRNQSGRCNAMSDDAVPWELTAVSNAGGRRAQLQNAAQITARIDRLPACRSTWMPVVLVSLAAIFELYDLFQTAYIPPGLVRDGIFRTGSQGFLGQSDQATFAAVTFFGLFLGAIGFSSIADRFGRRMIFVWALLAYSASTALLALQSTVLGIDLCRLLAGIGIGIELVTIDAYIAEIVPKHMRGRAFALNHFVEFCALPILAFLAWLLVPRSPLGISGWRYVVFLGSAGALFAWWLRRGLPESPRWLAQQGYLPEARRIVEAMEVEAERETGQPLPAPGPGTAESLYRASLAEIWKPPYARRTIMLMVFNFFQTIGFFGFTNWLPELLATKGQSFSKSLFYSFCIAFANPLSALFWSVTVAERFERKWLIVAAAAGVAICGPLFATVSEPALLVTIGVLITGFSILLSLSFHPYQAELYPTQIRARAVGFVYSFSRISTALTSFLIAYFLQKFGTTGVFGLISASMLIVVLSIGIFGPRTRGIALEDISH